MARRASVPIALAALAVLAVGGAWWLLAGREPDGAGSTSKPLGATGSPTAGDASTSGLSARSPGGVAGDEHASSTPPIETLGTSTPGRRAFGRVIDRTGAGVAKAQVSGFRDAPTSGGLTVGAREPLATTARTDSGGRFELLALPTDGPLGLEVRHADFATAELTPFTVSEAQSTDLGDIALEAGVLLIGNVRAVGGQPLADAEVTLTEMGAPSVADGGPAPQRTTTRADGEYRFDHLAPRQFTVQVRSAGYAPRAATLALLLGNVTGNVRQDFQLQLADAAIAGQVFSQDDRPVPDLELRLSQQDRNTHDYLLVSGSTDAQGRFRFDEVAQGLYQVEVLGADFYLPKALTVQGGEQALTVRVQPARAVHGRLTGAAGTPRAFRVTAKPVGATGARLLGDTRPSLTVTAAEPPGTFEFAGLYPGTYRFEIRAEGYAATTSADIVLGTESATADVLIALEIGGAIDGRIAPPAADVAIELRAADYDPAAPMEGVMPTRPIHDLVAQTDAEGGFGLEHVPAGRYTLTARAADNPPLHVRDLEIVEGGRLDVGLLELPRGGVIFGNVMGFDGEPSAGVRVTAFADGQQEQAVTDASGAFRLRPLPAGDYDLRATPSTVWAALRYEALGHVTVQAGEETPVLLTFTERAANPR